MIGDKVPEEEPAWQLLMTLKDVVELVMSPTFTEESIGYLDSLIAEHRQRFKCFSTRETDSETPFCGTLSTAHQSIWPTSVFMDNEV